MLGPLSDPAADGGDSADAFHVVVPSMPRYGFSGPTNQSGFDVNRVADAVAELMAQLGYARYVAQGGDWCAIVTRRLGEAYADRPRRLDPREVPGLERPRRGRPRRDLRLGPPARQRDGLLEGQPGRKERARDPGCAEMEPRGDRRRDQSGLASWCTRIRPISTIQSLPSMDSVVSARASVSTSASNCVGEALGGIRRTAMPGYLWGSKIKGFEKSALQAFVWADCRESG